MKPMLPRYWPAAALAAALSPAFAGAADQADLDVLRQRLARLEALVGVEAGQAGAADHADVVAGLDQRLRILERKLELQQEDTAAKALVTPTVSLSEKGLAITSPEKAFDMKLRGTLQADYRGFFGDQQSPLADSFLWRRIRPTLEGTLGPLVVYRLTPEFAGDTATIVDAYVDLRFDPKYTLRVGKMKGPVGLERLQSASALELIERGYPTELAPNRDLGVQLQGEFAQGRANYAIGVFNGAADGRDASTQDGDNNLEYAGRVFFEPWKNDASVLSGLGFGLAGSAGEKDGAGNNFLPRYRTPGQNVFFTYRAPVQAQGSHVRWSPQAYYYRNAFGVLAEYIASEQELRVGTRRAELSHEAFSVTGSWVLTGEDAGYKGVAKPDRPYQVGGESWGAFELVLRYGELDIDDAAFPLFADANASATRTRAYGLGLNWFPTSNLKLAFNHTHASFEAGAAGGADREDEKTFFSRVQVAF